MARPSASGALLLLVLVALSLLAVAHCRAFEIKADDPADSAAAVVVSNDDENGAFNPTFPAEVAVPTEERTDEQHGGGGFLRLPSHRHRPCRHGHGHLWWARHHGVFGAAPHRFHFRPRHGAEEQQRLAVFPAVETEAKAVAEPDPDRSLPASDEPLVASTVTVPASFRDADGAREEAAAAVRRPAHDDDGEGEGEGAAAAVRAWKEEMVRKWIRFHSRHGMRHHDEHGEEDDEAAGGEKRFHLHHRRHHEEDRDEEMNPMRKRLREAEHDEDSDEEDEDVEEMVRRFRKAVMARRRRRFGHGRRFHHHHHGHGYRHHAEEGEKADGEEESGVMAWIKGLMNRF